MSDACPGQSTRVYCTSVNLSLKKWPSGSGIVNDENPRSNVIPRSALWGFLSKAAVLAFVLNVFAKLFCY